MCRKNQLTGLCLICLGVGILLGIWIRGAFFSYLLSVCAILGGCLCLYRK